VKLTADGKSYTQPLTVKMDPRVKTSLLELQQQFDVAQQVAAKSAEVARARGEVAAVRSQIANLLKQATADTGLLAALNALDTKAAEIGGVTPTASPDSSGVSGPTNDISSLMFVGGELGQISGAVEGIDAAPSLQVMTAFANAQKLATAAITKWNAAKAKDLPDVNAQLQKSNLQPIPVEGATPGEGRGRRGQ
jgi:hypothetical protein